MQSSMDAALTALKSGQFVVVADEADRENEGDLIIAAASVTTEKLAFMLRHTSGVVCVAASPTRARALDLPLMVADNREPHRTQFTVSVDLAHGITTGISAGDRGRTIRALGAPDARAADFVRPGHIFPLRARPGGVLERPGHTEAAVDLARMAGFEPAGALAELMAEDGSMLSGSALAEFARRHDLPFLHIAELVQYRRSLERAAARAAARPAQGTDSSGVYA